MQYTENYSLKLPGYGDNADVGDLNDNTTAIDALIHANRQIEAPAFSTDTAYTTGDMCVYENVLYKFTADKAAGNWDSTKVTATNLADEVTDAAQSGGTTVIANPAEPATADLHKLQVENTVYGIPDPTVTKEVQSATGTQYVEFTDGADAPLVKCTTTIQGNQDLHGYDKPWVGGANINKMPPLTNGTYTSNGLTATVTDNSITVTGQYTTAQATWVDIPFVSAVTIPSGYYLHIRNSEIHANTVLDFDSQANILLSEQNRIVSISALTSCTKIRFFCNANETEQFNLTMQLSIEQTNSVTEWTPYSNICPITAYTENTIWVGGDNHYNEATTTEGVYISSIGEEVANYVAKSSDYITVTSNEFTLGYNSDVGGTQNCRVHGYDKSKNWVQQIALIVSTTVNRYHQTFSIPDGIAYIRFSIHKDFYAIMLNEGSTPLSYKPYNPNTTTHTATFSNSIYQGNADFVGSKATATWGYIASYNGETLPGEWISSMDEYAPGTTPTTGAQVAYALATPTTETITPTNLPIKSLFGYNHIESSTGEMEVEYITGTYQPLVDLIQSGTGHTYSTQEQVVGKWIDGKTIYEKTYTNATEQSVSYQTWTPTVISATDIDRIVNLFTTRDADGGIYIPVVTRKENGYVEIFAAVGWTYNNITIQYTKTSSNTRSLSKGATEGLKADLSEEKKEIEEVPETEEMIVKKAQSEGEEVTEKTEEPVEEPTEKEENER